MEQTALFDIRFNLRLEQWTTLRRKRHDLFSQLEIDTLDRAERSFNPGGRKVVLLAFENRFASLGGLSPVMKQLPHQLKKMGERVVFLSPFHDCHPAMKAAHKEKLFTRVFGPTRFNLCDYETEVSCFVDTSAELPTYYVRIPGRFTAGDNPYGYENPESLLLDALSFSAAVPFVLKKLGMTENLLFHAHEWETAPIAVTSKLAVLSGVIRQARTLLTLHNSFDSAFPDAAKRLFLGKTIPGHTVLQCAIPYLSGPLLTVSAPFAHEVSHDPLQCTVFTDHLQTEFSMNPPIGIENGIFSSAAAPFTDATIADAERGNVERLLTRKNTCGRRFLLALDRVRDPRIIGKIRSGKGTAGVPLFFMAGRLDFMQKGFDVMACAFERLTRGSAKLFFCPSSASANGNGLDFFKKIVSRCEGDFEIWPFKIPRRLYEFALRGSAFFLMPSLYEPFGSANESLTNGTPIVARGTGGLWVQVHPLNPIEIPSFYDQLHLTGTSQSPNGILFRERYPDELAEKEWRTLMRLAPEERLQVPLFESLVDSAHRALEQAIEVYSRPNDYAALMVNAIREVKKFSWEKAAAKYRQVYEVASQRGI
jgi:glycogen synthase